MYSQAIRGTLGGIKASFCLQVSDFHALGEDVALQLLLGMPDRLLQRVQLLPGVVLKLTNLESWNS